MKKSYDAMTASIHKYMLEEDHLTLYIHTQGVENQEQTPLLRLELHGVRNTDQLPKMLGEIIATMRSRPGNIERLTLSDHALSIWCAESSVPRVIECDHLSEIWEDYDAGVNAPVETASVREALESYQHKALDPKIAMERVRSFIEERSDRITKRMEWRKDNPEAVKCCEEQLDLLHQLKRLIRDI